MVKMESTQEDIKAKRYKRTVYLMCFTSGLSSAGFSYVMASIWPYMKKLDPNVTETFLGWTVASYSVSQLLSSLFCGYWLDRGPSLRPLLITQVSLIFANIIYAYAHAVGPSGVWMLLAARILTGISSGNITITRSVVAKLSDPKNLSKQMAWIGIAQSMGVSVGPALQVLSTPVGSKGIYVPSIKFRLDFYTTPAYLFIVLGVCIWILLLKFFDDGSGTFTGKSSPTNKIKQSSQSPTLDGSVANGQEEAHQTDLPEKQQSLHPVDLGAVFICLILFNASSASLAISETLTTPVLMTEQGFSRKKTVQYAGIILTCTGITATFSSTATGRLVRKFNDRIIMLIGFSLLIFGHALYLPWGPGHPKVINVSNGTETNENGGCPSTYHWCLTDPKLWLPQYVVGLVVVFIGFPMSYVVIMVVYTKVIGPHDKGKYMSWLDASASTGRILGPIYVTALFKHYGIRWTSVGVNALYVSVVTLLLVSWRRLIPYNQRYGNQQSSTVVSNPYAEESTTENSQCEGKKVRSESSESAV